MKYGYISNDNTNKVINWFDSAEAKAVLLTSSLIATAIIRSVKNAK